MICGSCAETYLIMLQGGTHWRVPLKKADLLYKIRKNFEKSGRWTFLVSLGHFYGKFVEKICLKAP